jgi:hypothetical protein
VGPEPGEPGQSFRYVDKSGDLLLAVDIGRRSVIPIGEQIRWRHFVARVHDVRIPGESPHHPEAIRPLGGLYITRLGSPLQGELGRDEDDLALPNKRDDALQ